ncbi:uncharacterized protein LOC142632757 [Castanea sativa]|uniref:uncharacterized protein LOC142632757 n=1 Tax=Castanea sativa TaxID=21020 RepID=UPI003F64CF26
MAMVQNMGGKIVEVFVDSRLVVDQVHGELEARDLRMRGYLNKARRLQLGFEFFTLQQIPRSKNTHVDSLATLATFSKQGLPRDILIEDLHKPTKEKKEKVQVHQVMVGPSWMDPLILFLNEGTLPDEKGEADKVQRKAPPFWLSEEQKLYRRSFSRPYLLCVHPEAVEPLLEELHEGICGSHINAEPLSNIRDLDAKKFVWKNIVTRFRIPHTLISDNGLQFDSKTFRRYCCELSIRNRYLTPAYPQGKMQVEAVNKVILNGLKKRLDEAKGRWVEELPHVL